MKNVKTERKILALRTEDFHRVMRTMKTTIDVIGGIPTLFTRKGKKQVASMLAIIKRHENN